MKRMQKHCGDSGDLSHPTRARLLRNEEPPANARHVLDERRPPLTRFDPSCSDRFRKPLASPPIKLLSQEARAAISSELPSRYCQAEWELLALGYLETVRANQEP